MKILLVLAVIVLLVTLTRRFLANRVWPASAGDEFTGTSLRLGETLVCCLIDLIYRPAWLIRQR